MQEIGVDVHQKIDKLLLQVLLLGLTVLMDFVAALPMPEARGPLVEHLKSTIAAIEADTLPAAARHYLAFLAVLKNVAPHTQTHTVRDIARSMAGLMVECGESVSHQRELDVSDA